MFIHDLKVNYLNNPLGIDVDSSPVFSWKYSQEFNLKQLSYRIIVSKDEKTDYPR